MSLNVSAICSISFIKADSLKCQVLSIFLAYLGSQNVEILSTIPSIFLSFHLFKGICFSESFFWCTLYSIIQPNSWFKSLCLIELTSAYRSGSFLSVWPVQTKNSKLNLPKNTAVFTPTKSGATGKGYLLDENSEKTWCASLCHFYFLWLNLS